jgi:alpha(1,3/1,4) fucosyltransferase
MRKIAIWNNYTEFAGNKLFDESAYGIGEDLGAVIVNFRARMNLKGYEVETLDIDSPDRYEKIIFLDYPSKCCYDVSEIPRYKKYLIVTECEMIDCANADVAKYSEFAKVFTYNDEKVKRNGCIKLPLANKFKESICIPFAERNYFVMMAGNKKSSEAGELYSERYSAIRLLEKIYPGDFDLYGPNWDRRIFGGNGLMAKMNRFGLLQRKMAPKRPSYRGMSDSKLATLSRYRYNICYENTCMIEGYISEKIFDSFFAGCVPVYLGAPNIADYIPKGCFINKRDFNIDREMFERLHEMGEEEFNRYLAAAARFLSSEKSRMFTMDFWADTVMKGIGV